MSKADKMFYNLGYVINDTKYHIDYVISRPNGMENYITFRKEHKDVSSYRAFTVQELKAINKKCEELGWLE